MISRLRKGQKKIFLHGKRLLPRTYICFVSLDLVWFREAEGVGPYKDSHRHAILAGNLHLCDSREEKSLGYETCQMEDYPDFSFISRKLLDRVGLGQSKSFNNEQ